MSERNKDELILVESYGDSVGIWIYHRSKLDRLEFPRNRYVLSFLAKALKVDGERFKRKYTTFQNKHIPIRYDYLFSLLELEETLDDKTYLGLFKTLSKFPTQKNIEDFIDSARIAYQDRE